MMPASTLTVLAAVAGGIVLAASSGLRAFLPLLGVGLAGRFGHWPLASSVQWLGSDPALIAFGVATLVEIVADKVPIVDHALDVVHTILGPVAAVLVSVSAWSQLSPQHALLLSIITGVPLAAGVHAVSAGLRLASTGTTGGLANPLLSIGEDTITGATVILAFIAPILAAILLLLVVIWMLRRWRRRRTPRPAAT
jgi:Domain of unknown function (DUF4126)